MSNKTTAELIQIPTIDGRYAFLNREHIVCVKPDPHDQQSNWWVICMVSNYEVVVTWETLKNIREAKHEND